jgi:hypothetical protein
LSSEQTYFIVLMPLMSSLRTAGPRSAGDNFVFFIVSLGLVVGLGLEAGLSSKSFGFSGIGL